MQVRYRKFPVLFIVIILLTHLFLVPLSIVYAQAESDAVEHSIIAEESAVEKDSDNSKSIESQKDLTELPQNDGMEIQELIDGSEDDALEPEMTTPKEEVDNNDKSIQIQKDPTTEEIRFSIDVGEYLEIQTNENFAIEVTTNQTIDSLRIVVPKGAEFAFSDEKNRTHLQTNDDESSVWLIEFNRKSDRFSAELSVLASGQISVEDSNGEIHSAFLYVNTGVSGRNAEILSESAARTTVTVSSWANFRTAWNNNNRTVIDATSDIPAGTTALNTRTSTVTLTTSTSTSFSPTIINTTGATLSSNSTVYTRRSLMLNTGNANIGALHINDLSRVIVNGNAVLSNVYIDIPGSTAWVQLTNNGSISMNFLSISGGSIRTNTTIPISSEVLLGQRFLIQSTSLGVAPIRASNIRKNIVAGGFAVWEDIGFSFTTPATKFWSRLSFIMVNNSITTSSQDTFNDSTFNLTNSVTAISSTDFSGDGGGVVMPPTPEEDKEPGPDPVDPPDPNPDGLTVIASPASGGSPQFVFSGNLLGIDSYNLSANTNPGFRFIRWERVSGDGAVASPTSEEAQYLLPPGGSAVVRAIYEPIVYDLILEASPSTGGTPEADLYSIGEGESTTLTANPSEGYDFIRWEITSGSGSSLEEPSAEDTVFTMGSSTTTVRAIYEEIQTNGPVEPVDPLNPEVEIDPENRPELPENQGLLSIDFISSFNFGSQAISVQDQTYYAKPQRLLNEDGTVNESEERPNYVQVSDRRSENDRNGWQLAVTQKEQFKNQTNQELTGARLNLSNQQLATANGGESPSLQVTNPLTLVPGNKRTLIRAEGAEGTGTWIYRFGNGETAGESVTLDVPKGANPEATTYSATLLWELSTVPGN